MSQIKSSYRSSGKAIRTHDTVRTNKTVHVINLVRVTRFKPLVDSYFTTDEKGKEVPIDGQKFKSNEDRKFIEDKLLHTVAPNIYPNYTEARQNCYFYMDQSDRYRNTWIGSGIAEASAAIMVPIAGRIMKKYADFEGQTPREYLYRLKSYTRI